MNKNINELEILNCGLNKNKLNRTRLMEMRGGAILNGIIYEFN